MNKIHLVLLTLFLGTQVLAGDYCSVVYNWCVQAQSTAVQTQCLQDYGCVGRNGGYATTVSGVSHCAGAIWCYVIPERSACMSTMGNCYWVDSRDRN